MAYEPPSEWAELDRNVALVRRVAADPSTPAGTLAHLAQSSEPGVRALVASNPNTPSHILQQLAAEFPDHFFANPVLPLLLVENPHFMRTMKLDTMLILLRSEHIPAWFVAGEHPAGEARHAMAMHVQRAGEAGEDWLEEAQPYIASAFPHATFYQLPHFVPPWLLRILVMNPHNAEVARSPDISPQELAQLAQSLNVNTCLAVAENPHTPPVGLVLLVQHKDGEVRLRVAQHPNATAEILHLLAAEDMMVIRRAVAYHAHTAPENLAVLASDRESIVRRAAAQHLRLDSAIRDVLAHDINTIVRATVARHPHLASTLLEALATDSKAKVRIGAAKNPALPQALLRQLAQDVHPRVRTAARKRLDSATNRAVAADQQTPLRLARNPHTSPSLLAKLAGDDDERVRAAVAANKATPPEILRQLAAAPNMSAQGLKALAEHPHIPFDILEELLQDVPWWYFHPLACKPGLTDAQRHTLYQSYLREWIRQHPLPDTFYGQRDASWLIALAVLENDDAMLRQGTSSLDWLNRLMVAMNPQAPRAVLDSLAHDGNRFVRAAAHYNSK